MDNQEIKTHHLTRVTLAHVVTLCAALLLSACPLATKSAISVQQSAGASSTITSISPEKPVEGDRVILTGERFPSSPNIKAGVVLSDGSMIKVDMEVANSKSASVVMPAMGNLRLAKMQILRGTTVIASYDVTASTENSTSPAPSAPEIIATPTFSVAAGAYGPMQTVIFSSTTQGVTFYSTVNGVDPTCAHILTEVAGSSISVAVSATVKVIACKTGYTDSAVASAAYVINGTIATPVAIVTGGDFSNGTYSNDVSVTLSTVPISATIYYAVGGADPTTSSTPYTGTITISGTTTLKAIAVMPNYSNSAVMSQSYTLTAATPTFSVAAGNYNPSPSVTLSSATTGASIYYTVDDGTTPTTAWALYSSAITVSSTQTIKAYAVKVNFTNSTVASAAYTINTAPGSPSAVVGTSGNSQISLTWTATSNGGSAITDYIVQYSSDSGTTWTTFNDGTSTNTSATVTSLTNGTAYVLRVAAVNAVGTGTYSSNSASVTPATIPGTPTGVVGTSGNSQISLTWTAPSNGGSAITDYMVQYSSNGGTTWTTFNDGTSTNTSATVTSLTNGTAYVLRVAAVNAVGTGTYSSNSASVTPATIPGTPTSVVGTSGNSQISLTWTAPATNGGSAITDYIVQYSSDSGTNWTTFNDAISTATSATVTGLANGTAYIFRVAAVNAVGIGSNSSNSASVTPATIPGTPTGVVGTSGNSQISLTWTAPATNGGSAITDYMVQYSSNGGTTWTTFNDGTSTNTSVIVTSLTNGTAYRLRVAAVNAVGTGTYSSNSASVTPVSTPGTPTGVVGTSGNSQISLTWTAPSNGGSAITDYIVQYSSDSGTNWTTFNDAISTATSATVTGLANGTAYIFRVAAVNAVGTGTYSSNSASVTSGTAVTPTAVVGTSGNAQVSLTWTAPATNGGSAITDYIVQYSSDSGTNWTIFNDGTSTATSATVTGLSNGTAYIFRVAAVNAAGTGTFSSNSASVTSGLPAAPTSVVGTSGNGQISLTWTAPANDGGSAITDYIVQYSSNSGTNWTTFNDGTSTATSATVTSLTNGTAYVLRVAAVNAPGTGTYSSNSASVTPVSIPGTPTSVVGTSGNSQVSLTWTAPSNNGSAITDYIVQYSSDSGANWTTFNDGTYLSAVATVTGLTIDTAYVFRVAAINGIGTGPYSANSSSVTAGCMQITSQPADINASGGMAGFAVEAAPGGTALSYQWQKSSTSGGSTFANISGQTGRALTLTGLTSSDNNFNYRVLVTPSCSVSVTSNAANLRVYSVPAGVSGFAGTTQVALTWAAPTGGASVTDYYYSYSSNGGTNWSAATLTGSDTAALSVTGLTANTSYIFRVAAVQGGVTGSYSASSATIKTMASGCAGDCYLEGTSPDFAQGLAIGTERAGPGIATLTLQYANGSSGFKIWKEKSGTRILNATGFPGAGWQESLLAVGTAFAGSEFITGSNIAGRVCPAHVFLSHAADSTMKARGRCIYYDGGNAAQALDAAGTSGEEAAQWLQGWDRVATGRRSNSSYFEGNIKTCADKGMRLPAMYETTMSKPSSGLPVGDGLTADPTWAGSTNGVPSAGGWTWTASVDTSLTGSYWTWSGTNSQIAAYDSSQVVRCALPSNIQPSDWRDVTTASGGSASNCTADPARCTMQNISTGLWWSKIQPAATWYVAVPHCQGLNHNGQTGWRLPTDVELQGASSRGITATQSANFVSNFNQYFYSSVTYDNWALVVFLANGGTANNGKEHGMQVVCVR